MSRSPLVPAVLALLLAPLALSAQTLGGYAFTLSNNFACTGGSGCTPENETTNQVVITPGGRLVLVDDLYETTASAFTSGSLQLTAGSIWEVAFDFGLEKRSFDGAQADGFAFVLQSSGSGAVGGGGSGVGYEGMAGASAAVGFRSFLNGGGWDNNNVFTGLDGAMTSLYTHEDWGAAEKVLGHVVLSFDGAGMLTIALNTTLYDAFDAVLASDAYGATTAFDLTTLTPNDVHVGFTAGTGLSTQYAWIENFSFAVFADGPGDPGSEVVPEPATMSLLALGLAGMSGVRRRKKR